MKNQTTTLHIDTTHNDATLVSLEKYGHNEQFRTKSDRKSQSVLPTVSTALDETGIKAEKISSLSVSTGPGSFIGIRIGVTVAKTLAFLLGVPVNGKSASDPIHISYTNDHFTKMPVKD